MLHRPLLLLLLLTVPHVSAGPPPALSCALPSPAPSAAAARGTQDPLPRLEVWASRAERASDGLEQADLEEMRALLREVEAETPTDPARRREIDSMYLDLAALPWTSYPRRSEEGALRLEKTAILGRGPLVWRLGSDPEGVGAWLADEVLASEREEEARRAAAASVLSGRYLEGTRDAMLRTARTSEGVVRAEVLDALAGWPDPLVHQFFVDQLEPGGHGLTALAKHLELARDTMGRGALDRVRELCGKLYLDADWRAAAQARELVRVLDPPRAVPLLMEALAVWERRAEEGRGSRRILWEIVEELRRVSGRSIGASVEGWRLWWEAVQSGRVDLPDTLEEVGERSSASFFGLQPHTERVLFVIDRSGSMQAPIGTDGRTRFEEARRQFLRFLEESGPATRFGVVLFADAGDRWRRGLSEATPSNLQTAGEWLAEQIPGGGTNLFEGLRTALRLDARGRLKLERVDADTVVVLCDGATGEGPEWVEPWMRTENEEAQLVFHCVQIGGSGDGTLQALAEGSRGKFVRVGG